MSDEVIYWLLPWTQGSACHEMNVSVILTDTD